MVLAESSLVLHVVSDPKSSTTTDQRTRMGRQRVQAMSERRQSFDSRKRAGVRAVKGELLAKLPRSLGNNWVALDELQVYPGSAAQRPIRSNKYKNRSGYAS
jgi:hypothetical protein